MNEITLIIDSNYLCYVHKFALSDGLSYRGSRTEIIFGFIKTILDLARRFETNKFIFCWDSKESLRKKLYPEYKSNRHNNLTEEEKENNVIAYAQFDKIKTTLPEMGFRNVFEEKGYESDDIIASLVVGGKLGRTVVISSDKDLYQLLEWCSLCNYRGAAYSKEMFTREYGIEPCRWKDVKAIAGCSTDNVKGVDRVGEKTAIRYLKGEMKKYNQTFKKIHFFDSDLTRRLTTLPFEGCPDFKSRLRKDECSPDKFRKVFEEFGFKSLLSSLNRWEKIF
jgi:DNA polymerase I